MLPPARVAHLITCGSVVWLRSAADKRQRFLRYVFSGSPRIHFSVQCDTYYAVQRFVGRDEATIVVKSKTIKSGARTQHSQGKLSVSQANRISSQLSSISYAFYRFNRNTNQGKKINKKWIEWSGKCSLNPSDKILSWSVFFFYVSFSCTRFCTRSFQLAISFKSSL